MPLRKEYEECDKRLRLELLEYWINQKAIEAPGAKKTMKEVLVTGFSKPQLKPLTEYKYIIILTLVSVECRIVIRQNSTTCLIYLTIMDL
jgi:hypothetical protein